MKFFNNLFDIKDEQVILGLNDELKAIYLYDYYLNKTKSILVVCNTLFEANNLYKSLSNYTDNVLFFPMDDFLTSEALAISPEFEITRLETINNLITNNKQIVVTNLMGLLRYLPTKENYEKSIIDLKVNIDYDIKKLESDLYNIGYHSESFVNKTGEYAPRGFVLDIFPLGNIDPMGYWTNTEFCMLIVIAILLIKWLYNIKLSDAFEGFVNGVKEMVPVAIYVFIANILFFIINSHVGDSGSTIFPTIANFFLSMTKKFNVLTFGFASIVGSIIYNDFPYMVNSLLEPINSLTKDYALVGMLTQSVHGLVMLVAPTSVILVIGLKYFDVSYKEWFKNIWKYLLIALIAVIIIITIMILV